MRRMNKSKLDVGVADRVETLGCSLVQHGRANDRVYLMKLADADYPAIIDRLTNLARKEDYTKIIAKVPEHCSAGFNNAGFEAEAQVPGFYRGSEDGFFMAKYFDDERAVASNDDKIDRVIERATQTPPAVPGELDDTYQCRSLTPDDANQLAALYRNVFETYPFPIRDPGFLAEAMAGETVFFGIFHDGELAAASSCEMDSASLNVEMTDFATRPDFRAQGLASSLLSEMGREMSSRGIKTAYTIARSVSYGMNITFAKLRYALAGTLINNTDISGSLESMNVWYKPLACRQPAGNE